MHIKLTAVGRLGKDPEAKQSKEGKGYTKFSIACTDSRKNTTWVNVVAFGKVAELCANYLQKGSTVLVEGTPKVSAYLSGQEAKSSLEVFADTVRFLSPRSQNSEIESTIEYLSEEAPF